MEEDRQDVHLQPEATEPEIVQLERDALADQLIRQYLKLREVAFWLVLGLYNVTLIATLTLLFLAGFGEVSFSDNVLISLSGVLVGESWVSALSSWLS